MWLESRPPDSARHRVITSRRGNGSFAANEFHSPSLPRLLRFPKQDAADLSRRRNMRATARGQIEIVHVDEPEVGPVRPVESSAVPDPRASS